MNPDGYGAYAPPVVTHGGLINAVHNLIAAHPHPERKVNYSKILQILLADQAKDHVASVGPGGAGAAGGPRQPVGQEATPPPPDQGIVTQNMSPLGWMLANLGGYGNADPSGLAAALASHPAVRPPRPGILAALAGGGY